MSIDTGNRVRWRWGQGWGDGEVTEVHAETVSRQFSGSEVTRHGDENNPALIIQQDDGDKVLKLASEVEPQ